MFVSALAFSRNANLLTDGEERGEDVGGGAAHGWTRPAPAGDPQQHVLDGALRVLDDRGIRGVDSCQKLSQEVEAFPSIGRGGRSAGWYELRQSIGERREEEDTIVTRSRREDGAAPARAFVLLIVSRHGTFVSYSQQERNHFLARSKLAFKSAIQRSIARGPVETIIDQIGWVKLPLLHARLQQQLT